MRRVIVILLLFALPLRAEAPSEWRPGASEHGISVRVRDVPGSALAEFEGRAFIDASVARVYAVIRDADRRTEWMERCVESRVVEQKSTGQVLYNRTAGTWPVADRDAVVEGRLVFDPPTKTLRLDFQSVENTRAPVRGDAVRMTLRGFWRLTAHPGGGTDVEYRVHADPGGFLPGWAANLVSQTVPLETIRRLREQVTKATYPEFESSFVQRPEYVATFGR